MRSKARILLIDDNEVDFVITRKMLSGVEGQEYELEWVESFEDGVSALQRNTYDACLVDYQLGARTGLDFLREAAHMGCGVPMILLTGRGDEGIDHEAMALDACAYLDKTRVDAAELDRTIRYGLKRDRLVSDLLDQNEELLRLHRLTEISLRSKPSHQVFREVAEEISQATGFPIVSIERYDPFRGTMVSLGGIGIATLEDSAEREVDVESSLSGEVVLTQRPKLEMAISEEITETLDLPAGTIVRSFACLPMVGDTRVAGALTLAHTGAHPIDSTVVNRAATFANHLGNLILRRQEAGKDRLGRPSAAAELRSEDSSKR